MSDRQKLIAGLRIIADALENNPLLPVPYFGTEVTRVDNLEQMIAVGKAYGGFWEKSTDDDSFRLIRKFSDSFAMMVYTARENVCTRVVVGTKTIPAVTLPAREETYMPERVEEVVEWHCPKSLSEIVREEKFRAALTSGEDMEVL